MNSWLSTKKREDWALVAILGIAFLFRFLYLGIKPPHFDEGINGWFVDQMILNGYYSYDPTNYHGPFHFYVLWVFKFLFGRNLWALRLSASAFGLAGVYLIARLKTYLGTFTAYGAAFLLAVSPGMTFYSRYGIHETELFFFSLVALHGFFRFRALRDKISVWLIGLGITGMVITKETFIVHLICFGLACLCLWLYEKVVPSKNSTAPLIKASKGKRKAPQAAQVTADFEKLPTPFSSNDILVVASVSILIFYLFYSGFFLHFQGVVDFFRSFAAWNDTAHKGNGHDKPFFYWLQLFWTYELAALLGLALTPFFLFPAPREIRLLAIYGVGVFLAYSLTPYKTPWCILNIVWPFYFVVAYFVF